MVAEEAHTPSSIKDFIVAAPGVADSQWEGIVIRRPVVS
jgi:enoyl reductase-like protein